MLIADRQDPSALTFAVHPRLFAELPPISNASHRTYLGHKIVEDHLTLRAWSAFLNMAAWAAFQNSLSLAGSNELNRVIRRQVEMVLVEMYYSTPQGESRTHILNVAEIETEEGVVTHGMDDTPEPWYFRLQNLLRPFGASSHFGGGRAEIYFKGQLPNRCLSQGPLLA